MGLEGLGHSLKQPLPRVDSLRISSFKNEATLYLAVKMGEIDLPFHFPMGNDGPLLPSLQGVPHLYLLSIGRYRSQRRWPLLPKALTKGHKTAKFHSKRQRG